MRTGRKCSFGSKNGWNAKRNNIVRSHSHMVSDDVSVCGKLSHKAVGEFDPPAFPEIRLVFGEIEEQKMRRIRRGFDENAPRSVAQHGRRAGVRSNGVGGERGKYVLHRTGARS